MQRLVGLTINDPGLTGRLFEERPELAEIARDMRRGSWGLAYYRSGEMLVRKCPIRSPGTSIPIPTDLSSHQLLLVADEEAAPRASASTMMPLRYRDWVFAMSGGPRDRAGFVERALQEDVGFPHVGRSLAETTMMVLIGALYRGNVLDKRGLTTDRVHHALAGGAQRLTSLAGGRDQLEAAVLLLVHPYLFGLALGRPLFRISIASQTGRYTAGRQALRATALVDHAAGRPKGGPVSWAGLELGIDGTERSFEFPPA